MVSPLKLETIALLAFRSSNVTTSSSQDELTIQIVKLLRKTYWLDHIIYTANCGTPRTEHSLASGVIARRGRERLQALRQCLVDYIAADGPAKKYREQ